MLYQQFQKQQLQQGNKRVKKQTSKYSVEQSERKQSSCQTKDKGNLNQILSDSEYGEIISEGGLNINDKATKRRRMSELDQKQKDHKMEL